MVRSFADQVASCLHHRQWLEVQARSKHPLSLLHMKSVFVTGYALCLFPTSCDFPRPRPSPCDFPRPRPHASFRTRRYAPAQIQCGGRFPDPRFTRYTDLTSQHAGHAARNFGAFQCHLAQSHVVQGLDALPPGVDVGLVEVTRGYRIGVEQRER